MLMLKRQVQDLIDKRAFTKAIGMAAEFFRRNPDSATALQLIATAEEAAGYTKAAIQTISRAIDLAPDEPVLRIMRARLLLRDRRLPEAIADVDTIVALGDAQPNPSFLDQAIACRNELLERLSAGAPPRGKVRATAGNGSQAALF